MSMLRLAFILRVYHYLAFVHAGFQLLEEDTRDSEESSDQAKC